jgi:large subunit ribosomal protein L35
MPKIKTNRMAHKKLRITASGKVKHARAGTSHNTGKRRSKRNRQLRASTVLDSSSRNAVRGMLPYSSKA